MLLICRGAKVGIITVWSFKGSIITVWNLKGAQLLFVSTEKMTNTVCGHYYYVGYKRWHHYLVVHKGSHHFHLGTITDWGMGSYLFGTIIFGGTISAWHYYIQRSCLYDTILEE